MKLFRFIILFPCLISIESGFSQSTKVAQTAKKLFDVIAINHVEDAELDDSSSSYIFDTFLEEMDPDGMFLLKEDITKLEAYRYSIDDEVMGMKIEFFQTFADIYKIRLEEGQTYLTELQDQKFNFLKSESVDMTDEGFFDQCESKDELKDKWRLWAKYSILEDLFDYEYVEDVINAPTDSMLAHIDEVSEYVYDDQLFFIKNFLENPGGYETYLGSFYLDAIATSFDPHTTYFSPVEKEKFEDDLSRGNFEFGFSLVEEKDGRVEISNLLPGSPAWNSNQINVGDEVISATIDGKKKIDFRKKSLDDFRILMNNINPEKLELSLMKQNGVNEKVSLVKGEVYVEEDVIKSVILDGEKKVGYITLPDFYTDWNDEGALGCANDVAKAIVKLQKENVEGLILDLRNNGGGSLLEAIDLAGIFIDWGPICVYKERNIKPTSIKDMNRGAIYSGPLLILVNGLSASASEIFSASMQNYNRALIAGSPTYGKSTGQIILPVDMSGSDQFGFVKVTTTKYYGIDKKTHQKHGVQPDVRMKDVYELYDFSESTYPNALSSDSIEKKLYFTPAADFQLSNLQSKSSQRIGSHDQFQSLLSLLDTFENSSFRNGKIRLHIEEYQEDQKAIDDLLETLFDEETYQSTSFQATNNQFDQKIMQMDQYRSDLNDKYLKRVQSDLYIEESYNILLDQIKLNDR